MKYYIQVFKCASTHEQLRKIFYYHGEDKHFEYIKSIYSQLLGDMDKDLKPWEFDKLTRDRKGNKKFRMIDEFIVEI